MVGPPSSWSFARPGGGELAGSACGSSARWPFTCLEAIPPVVVTGHPEHVFEGSANLVAPDLALAPILPAMRIAGHLATPFIPQLTDGLSRSWLRSGGQILLKIVFVLLIAWPLGVLGLYRIGDLVHVLLLVGLTLLPLGALAARDAAAARARDVGSGQS